MPTTETVVIGAGHAGLAVSRLLTGAGRHHVVLDRGRVGERWRTERWDSLHLLTPSWMSRLPGWTYAGPEPEGYLSGADFVRHLEGYASSFDAPVVGGTTVQDLSAARGGYRIATDNDTWHTRQVVVATGPHGRAHVPAGIERLDGHASVITSNHYRNPAQIAPGGVLVVGASSAGVQIADELVRAGRHVTLSVGRHTRMPRRYRGMDAFWWLEATGRLARTIDDMPDRVGARREPSLQMVGHNDPGRYGQDLDLAALRARGVRLVGRVQAVSGHRVHLGADLADHVAAAEHRMYGFLAAVDRHVEAAGLAGEVWPSTRPRPVEVPETPDSIDLRAEGIGTVLVAAGYRPDHDWLRLPVTDPDGHLRQYRGRTPAPGLHVVGQRFQHRRDSGFIDGARHDARVVVQDLLAGSHAELAGLPGEATT